MMKELLESYFGKHYQSTKKAGVTCQTQRGLFTLSDQKACDACKRVMPNLYKNCDKTVLKCDSANIEVEVIELESFIDNYAHLKTIPSDSKCDLLLTNHKTIVLCDMTCSKSKYIAPFKMSDGTEKIGKRNTVRRQIENSIALLQNVPEIADAIQAKPLKIALFAYREKPEVHKDKFDAKVVARMKLFNTMSSNIAKFPMFSIMKNGFHFSEVRYPDIYSW